MVISIGRYCLIGDGCVMRYVRKEATGLHLESGQTSVQDIPRQFQLLSYEDRRLCSHRRKLCCRSSNYRQPCGDRQELCDCKNNSHFPSSVFILTDALPRGSLPSSKTVQRSRTIRYSLPTLLFLRLLCFLETPVRSFAGLQLNTSLLEQPSRAIY